MSPLFPALTGEATTPERPALRFGERSLTYAELAAVTDALADRIKGGGRVAVWATPTLETAVAVVAALRAGVPAVPLNPKSGEKELGHILSDSAPSLVLAAPGDELPAPVRGLERVDVDVRDVRDVRDAVTTSGGPAPDGRTAAGERTAADTDAALIVYTSGTTGPPKGAVIPRRAIATTLDALADAWQWTADDVLVHALPLFHVHGLILGILGPLRRGGSVRHLGRFDTTAVAQELSAGATMLFGVPTMYHRIAETLPTDPELAKALGRARLLVSGSAALPVHDHERIAAATGRRVIERYGMTETLMNTSVRADGEPRAGTVGLPLPGVELRLVEDDGTPLTAYDGESVGEIQVRGPNLFTEYLNRPDATAAAFTADGWFRTGDMAVRDPDGYVRIVGRKATDLIKSGGYKIGAGEIENALLEHPGVREAAVTGEPDPDLGERVVAWIVPTDPQSPPPAPELATHVATHLSPHKRPRTVHYLSALPRNDMGKIMKRALKADEDG
ncbi:acyl-CoA synthetase [Streptomyces europaeiscabiei]|uniref:Acyl-CoA synthetase n=2 Tax=Streptomyces europaeiscabiei TaxID=146819 RepID=A0ABU4ND42_9ACTN|nr:acyl-CoA synthetase [Streptomyces europaeiscabiei]MDX2523910.1 acyl-CoA synthetase [Streptomyces europaeiscabiei]MDX3545184.1 acyl-CoA synthetase [Streptomyces europaeiscabiei]MDX3554175.1 acyl-CoA synthetase [Streptomyces europaeiscabiei]MDX3666549.1 acyl-CoA synthetase [Streptomyces europaeiscabiei]MDX3699574.1 acyl-CoA synthetase [Streptomyces europaeiscabiei]